MRPLRRFRAGILAGTIALAVSCGGSGDGHSTGNAPDSPARVNPPRNLLLVTIDTLRADRVGVYGYVPARTPSFDAIAGSGVRFSRAFAPAPITLPSHASLLTGLNPPAHGARHNGIPLRDTVPTLATILAGSGFATAAFVSAFPLDRRFGLGRGFGTYDGGLPRGEDGRPLNERPGAVTVDRAIAWLDGTRMGSAPFFLWVHLFEPHAPYGDSAPDGRRSSVSDRYDAEIAEADRQAGRLLDRLGPARASTLVVITADHGEAFGEHGEVAHSLFVYDTTLRAPLAIAGPGLPRDGRAIDRPVSLVDVAPTVLSLMGRSGGDMDGIDLRRTIDGSARPDSPRTLYAESFAPLFDFGWSPLQSVREGELKFIAAPKPELFDVAGDPAEEHNLMTARPADATRLAGRVERIAPAVEGAVARIEPDAAARLGALGYVTPGRTPSAKSRIDPKDRRALAARLAEIAAGEIDDDRLVPVLEGVLREDAGNTQAHLRLGVALSTRGDCARAGRHLRTAIGAGLPSADPFISLAYCFRRRNDIEGARRILTEAQRLEPGNPIVAANLGLLALDSGRLPEAITQLSAAVERDPDLHEARFALARALAREGRRDAARDQAETLAAKLPPDAPQRSEVERLLAALR